jgi:hypothetical protein
VALDVAYVSRPSGGCGDVRTPGRVSGAKNPQDISRLFTRSSLYVYGRSEHGLILQILIERIIPERLKSEWGHFKAKDFI